MNIKAILVVITSIILITACNSDRIFKENHTFDKYNWLATDTLIYSVDINNEESKKDYSFKFNIRYITGFQYKFLNINVKVICPDGTEYNKTESIQIRKDNSEYIGDGIGSYWDIDYTVKEKFTFKQEGRYFVKISPIIDEDRLLFINELGFTILR